MSTRPKIRLFVDQPLNEGQSVSVSRDHANYLFNVMRLDLGAEVALFNGQSGEWRAQVAKAGKRAGVLVCQTQTAPQVNPPDVWLLFAPIKKARTDFIVEKATELGVARICPIHTDFTNSDRIRQERLQAHAVEAAEQCGATFVPEVTTLAPLSKVLEGWDESRSLIFADEAIAGEAAVELPAAPAALVIGPEGGFSEPERNLLRTLATSLPLGPRILRADTAAVAALTLWQASKGDWN